MKAQFKLEENKIQNNYPGKNYPDLAVYTDIAHEVSEAEAFGMTPKSWSDFEAVSINIRAVELTSGTVHDLGQLKIDRRRVARFTPSQWGVTVAPVFAGAKGFSELGGVPVRLEVECYNTFSDLYASPIETCTVECAVMLLAVAFNTAQGPYRPYCWLYKNVRCRRYARDPDNGMKIQVSTGEDYRKAVHGW